MKQYRYPGAKPFTTQEKNLFFGRNKEAIQLLQLIRLEQLVVLYSKSGLGKSSLLNAAIIPNLEEEGSYEPLPIRFGSWAKNAAYRPLDTTREALLKNHDRECFLDYLFPEENSLWFLVKKRQMNGGHDRFLLVFDQFEELFSYAETEVLVFKKELNELLSAAVPTRIRRMLDILSATQSDLLTEEEEQQLYRPVEIKMLFAIRSDRMHLMDKLSDYLPNILRHNYELKALNREDARSAIVEPARKEGDFFNPSFTYESQAIEKVLAFLEDDETRVEAIQLQILCQSFEEKVQREGITHISVSDIGELESIIANYYHSRVAGLGNEDDQIAARRLIEEGLVLEEEQQRLSLHEGQVTRFFDVSQGLLARLVDSHLLRAEPGPRGGYTYELSHDTLIQPVLAAKRERKKEEVRLAKEAEQLQQQKIVETLRLKAEEERRQREKEEGLRKEAQAARVVAEKEKDNAKRNARKARMAAVTGFVLGLLASMAFIIAFSQYQTAQQLQLEAERQRDRAATLALENEKKAKEAADSARVALKQREIAEKASEVARIRSEEAQRQAQIARINSYRAEQALEEANRQKALALQAAIRLEEQKNRIEEQRLLTDREARQFEEQAAQLQQKIKEIDEQYWRLIIQNQGQSDSLILEIKRLKSVIDSLRN